MQCTVQKQIPLYLSFYIKTILPDTTCGMRCTGYLDLETAMVSVKLKMLDYTALSKIFRKARKKLIEVNRG